MNTKQLFATMLVTALPLLAAAQDKIYKTDGSIIEVKIKSVGVKAVTYTRSDNQSGPEYTVYKRDVDKIVYQNGNEDVFASRRPRPQINAGSNDKSDTKEKKIYGRSVVALSPMQFTENGLGASISYERALDKRGLVAFYVPVIFTVNPSNNYDVYTTGVPFNKHRDVAFYAMPGIKIYPTGSFGVVRYGLGPSLVVSSGEKTNVVYDVNGYPVNNTLQRFMLGMVLNNSLNINPSQHLYLGLEFGLGFTYLHTVDGNSENTRALVQGGFKIGYRF